MRGKLVRGKLAAFVGLVILGVLPAAAQPAAPAAPQSDRRLFDITRYGNKIGTEVVEIDKDGATTNITFTTHISVVIAFVQFYHFDHSATEVWSGGKFVSYKAQTDDNGTKHEVSAVVDEANNKLNLDIDGTHSEAAPDLVPASWWNKDFVNRTDMFDSETGRRLSVKVTDLGDESIVQNGNTVQARHYKVSGDLDRDLWFDGDTLVRIQLTGNDNSTIISDLREETGGAGDQQSKQDAAPE